MATVKKARFDTRISKEQKRFFERAARLGGYGSLTDFVLLTALDKAKQIIEETELRIASEKDSKIFFEAITSPPKPTKRLLAAANDYKSSLSK